MTYVDNKGQLKHADAAISISGRVTTAINTSVAGAKVWFEAPSGGTCGIAQRAMVTANAFGNYQITTLPSGCTYTVDASLYGYQRARYGTVSSSTTNVNIIINPQTTKTLDVFVAADEEFRNNFGSGWLTTAWNKITQGELAWRNNWNIKYNLKTSSAAWTSPNGVTSCNSLHTDLGSDTGWTGGAYQGADVVFAYRGESGTLTAGDIVAGGCVDVIPSSPNQHPKAIVNLGSETLNSHEIGHLYGFQHSSTNYWCMMQQNGALRDLDEMYPAYDNTMAITTSSPKRAYY